MDGTIAKPIFVFGSNLLGIHGAGAAKYAMDHHGAMWGEPEGHFGDSFALPTKDEKIHTLSLDRITSHVDYFLTYAEIHPELEFNVTRVGCGLAGLKESDIAPMFRDATPNCHLPHTWRSFNGEAEDDSEWSSIDR